MRVRPFDFNLPAEQDRIDLGTNSPNISENEVIAVSFESLNSSVDSNHRGREVGKPTADL